jgi:hypothetical protein
MGSAGVCSMNGFKKFSPEYSEIEKVDIPDDGFDRVDSRGVEGSTKTGSVFPELVDEELEDIEVEVMFFWEALQLCVEEDEPVGRLVWEDDIYIWFQSSTNDMGPTLMTFTLGEGYPTPYTPTQEDMLVADWILVPA